MDNESVTKVRGYIEELLAGLDDQRSFDNTESLIKTGRLDSLVVVKLILFLEMEFGVDFTQVEFDPDRFDSVNEIAQVIEESRALS